MSHPIRPHSETLSVGLNARSHIVPPRTTEWRCLVNGALAEVSGHIARPILCKENSSHRLTAVAERMTIGVPHNALPGNPPGTPGGVSIESNANQVSAALVPPCCCGAALAGHSAVPADAEGVTERRLSRHERFRCDCSDGARFKPIGGLESCQQLFDNLDYRKSCQQLFDNLDYPQKLSATLSTI